MTILQKKFSHEVTFKLEKIEVELGDGWNIMQMIQTFHWVIGARERAAYDWVNKAIEKQKVRLYEGNPRMSRSKTVYHITKA